LKRVPLGSVLSLRGKSNIISSHANSAGLALISSLLAI
jgi:hypothetical protein